MLGFKCDVIAVLLGQSHVYDRPPVLLSHFRKYVALHHLFKYSETKGGSLIFQAQ